MSSAHRYLPNYTVADYQRWEGDWELWQGIPVAMTPSPFGRHQKIAARLVTLLSNAIDEAGYKAVVMAEIDWIISNHTVVRPDVVVLCGDAPERHIESAPAIVAEILSDSSQQRDREAKFELYQENGASLYLILDPDQNTMQAFELDVHGRYQSLETAETLSLGICDHCQLEMKISKLFT
jgi:Uma2 family endonuclease